jgi:hypothetical protein
LIGSPGARAVPVTPAFTSSAGPGTETFTADTGTQTTDFLTQFNIPQFNPSLGTLNSLSVTLAGSMGAVGSVTNSGNGAATSVGISQNSTVTDNPPQLIAGSYSSNITTGSANGDSLLLFKSSASASVPVGNVGVSTTISGISLGANFTPQTVSESSGFDPNLIGNGTFGILLSTGEFTSGGGTGGNLAFSATTGDDLNLAVTYNYTPAAPPPPSVPEPAPLTLIGIGLIGTAAIVRRRRQV